MHLHFERTTCSRTDCTVLSLTWMGKVPDELPEEVHGWKLNRVNYYQDGWLATGNTRGIVGVTFTTCHCRKTTDLPHRTNYNLRGHRSEVTLVKWNEPYQKLASCDSSGIIFVWIKYEGRWSIELINDRNTQVTDFSWSHDGRMALICYLDGFVLVGSVAGQRYWSSMLNLEATITCGIWTPDDQQVFFGTSNGQVLVIDVHGAMVAQVSVLDDVTICAMAWSCEKFKMEETDEDEGTTPTRQPKESKPSVLAVCFQNGTIYLMKNYDDVSPVIVDTGLRGIQMEWSNSGELLAVAGVSADSKPSFFENFVHFYTEMGVLRFVIPLSCTESPVTALTWGHNDKRLFIATGCVIHIGWVTRRVASLQLLSRLAIHRCLQDESYVQRLPLPRRLRGLITNLFGQTIRCCLPDPQHLREFVSCPPANNIRLHCTMIRHDDDVVTGSATYTLYLEYLGGLVPLLKGKRASKIRPEFVIFDPQYPDCGERTKIAKPVTMHSQSPPIVYSRSYTGSPIPPPRSPVFPETSSDSEVEEGCASPRMQRRRRNRRQAQRDLESAGMMRKELVYLDELPEHEKLVSITSNIWGTKFKLLGLVPWLPTHLGAITYRTSLLHLQPRQMTLVIKELRGPQAPECHAHSHGSIASSSSGLISSDDDDDFFEPNLSNSEECAPVAPMTPRKHLRCSGQPCATHHPQSTLSASEADRTHMNGSSDYINFIPNEEFLTIETAGNDKVPIVSFDSRGARLQDADSSLMSVATQTSFHSIAELHQSARRSQTSDAMSPSCEHCKCCCRNAHRVKLEDSGASKSEMVTPGISAASSEDQLTTDATHQSDSLASDVHIMVNGVDQASSESFEDDPRSSISLDLRPVCSGIDSSSEGSVFATAEEASLRTKADDDVEGEKLLDSQDEARSHDVETRANLYNSASRLASIQNELEIINRKVWHKSRQSSPAVPSSGLYSTCGSPGWDASAMVHRNGDSDMHLQPNMTNNHHAAVGDLPRWADKAGDLKFIDEDADDAAPEIMVMGNQQYGSGGSSMVFRSSRNRSVSHVPGSEFLTIMDGISAKDTQRRLTLKPRQASDARSRTSGSFCRERMTERKLRMNNMTDEGATHTSMDCISIGSDDPTCFCDIDAENSPAVSHSLTSLNRAESKKASRSRDEPFSSCPNITADSKVSSPVRRTDRLYVESPLISRSANSSPCGRDQRDSVGESFDMPSPIHLKNHRGSLPHTDNLLDGSRPSSPMSRSIPSSPVVQRKKQQQRKGLLYSPLLLRKVMRQRLVESSDDEVQSGEDVHVEDFKDLESFQKAYIRKKMKKRRGRVQPDNLETCHSAPAYRELILHNKAPLWNEVSQVYQLDFGGRVTQESAKNFQIEFRGKQVMQFGRIDGNAYTLDFQYPFCALQAFAVALANVTQRLK